LLPNVPPRRETDRTDLSSSRAGTRADFRMRIVSRALDLCLAADKRAMKMKKSYLAPPTLSRRNYANYHTRIVRIVEFSRVPLRIPLPSLSLSLSLSLSPELFRIIARFMTDFTTFLHVTLTISRYFIGRGPIPGTGTSLSPSREARNKPIPRSP